MLIRAFSLAAVAHATYVLDASFPNLTNVPKNILANFSNVRCVAYVGQDTVLPASAKYGGGGASDAQICSVSQNTQPSSATQLAQVRCAAQGSQSQTSQSQYSGASQYPSAR